jgi:CRISPR-associated RAMP protein (TIGR02581 family)
MIKLTNRYMFTGRLVMRTALHIGGGRATLSSSGGPIVLTPEERPFIPGSSFKGALRSCVEKWVPMLPETTSLFSCGLPTSSDKNSRCPTAQGKDPHELTLQERDNICHTCQLFGSPFAASHININDLYLAKDKERPWEDDWSGIIQIRDGVAIDRDSETAVDGLKYDFEVVPATTAFGLTIILENATAEDLQLISIGLSEFMSGLGAIGGKRSRGLGACILQDVTIFALELENTDIAPEDRKKQLINYLLEKDDLTKKFPVVLKEVAEVNSFLRKHISAAFSQEAGRDA